MKLFISLKWWTFIYRLLIYFPIYGIVIIYFLGERINTPVIFFFIIMAIVLKKIFGWYIRSVLLLNNYIYVPTDLNLIYKIQYRVKVFYKDIEMIEYNTNYGVNERNISIYPTAKFNYLIITKKDGTKKHIEISGFTIKQVRKIEKIIIKKSPNVIVKIKYDDFISGAWAK